MVNVGLKRSEIAQCRMIRRENKVAREFQAFFVIYRAYFKCNSHEVALKIPECVSQLMKFSSSFFAEEIEYAHKVLGLTAVIHSCCRDSAKIYIA